MNFQIDDADAWFLTEILDRVSDKPELFHTQDENEEETYDEEFHNAVIEMRDSLLKQRGVS